MMMMMTKMMESIKAQQVKFVTFSGKFSAAWELADKATTISSSTNYLRIVNRLVLKIESKFEWNQNPELNLKFTNKFDWPPSQPTSHPPSLSRSIELPGCLVLLLLSHFTLLPISSRSLSLPLFQDASTNNYTCFLCCQIQTFTYPSSCAKCANFSACRY